MIVNHTLLILFVLAALSMLTALRLTSPQYEMLRASAGISALGHALAALYMLTRSLGWTSPQLGVLTEVAVILLSVGALTYALGLVLERHYHEGPKQ